MDLTEALNKILSADRSEVADIGFERLEKFTTAKMLENLDPIYTLAEESK